MSPLTPKDAVERYRRAKERRSVWESHWEECYEYCLPHRDAGLRHGTPGGKRGDKVFDGTAPDAVDQLAASLMAQLTPPWTHWLGFFGRPRRRRTRPPGTCDRTREVDDRPSSTFRSFELLRRDSPMLSGPGNGWNGIAATGRSATGRKIRVSIYRHPSRPSGAGGRPVGQA